MSDLRDEIKIRLIEYAYDLEDGRSKDRAADAILAAVYDALLTQDAVSHAILAHRSAEHTSPMAAAITAALEAAGIVKGEEQ